MSVSLKANKNDVRKYLLKIWNNNIKDKKEDNIKNKKKDNKKEENIKNKKKDNIKDDKNKDISLQYVSTKNKTKFELEIYQNNSNIDFSLLINKKSTFIKYIKNNLNTIKNIGNEGYTEKNIEKTINININTITEDDIKQVYEYLVGNNISRSSLIKNISKCTIFPKYKAGDTTKPENFRYLVNHHNTIKIIDRLWCLKVIKECGTNLPDPSIYKSNLIKSFNVATIITATRNTESIDSVVLLDIERAFDSLEWNILEELLIANLSRKINSNIASDLVNKYMIIIKNRKLYYNGLLIKCSKGIPTGLPSSNIIFTFALEEIIFRWLNYTNYSNNIDFIINIFVDDIYIKILNILNADNIISSLIMFLNNYKLYVNKNKSKADPNLKLTIINNNLVPSTYYLGIPFTRDIKLYGELILKEFQINKINISWNQIYDILISNESSKEKKIIIGFMNYKLKPFINKNNLYINDFNNESSNIDMSTFIFKHYYINNNINEEIEEISETDDSDDYDDYDDSEEQLESNDINNIKYRINYCIILFWKIFIFLLVCVYLLHNIN